jgi:hypothetical protein
MTYTKNVVLIGSGSTSTSGPVLVNDFLNGTLSWQSSASLGPSRFTVEGSHADGLQTADLGNASQTTAWSLVTGVNIIGRPTGSEEIELGYRWLRVSVPPANHSAASSTTITLNMSSS